MSVSTPLDFTRSAPRLSLAELNMLVFQRLKPASDRLLATARDPRESFHRLVGITLLIAFGLWLALGTSVQAAVFYPTSFKLANGLQVIVVTNRLSPVVHQMVWYKVGAADEPAGKSGLAHYLEHLMFRGTDNVPAGQFSKVVAAQGGHDNAFTSYDYTAYYEEVEASRLPLIMQMEADRMHQLRLAAATAKPELRVILRERQQRTDNSPEGRFMEKLNQKLMPDYPYGKPLIGWRRDIEKLTVADARKFYQTYYAPNNAIVVISGDVKVEEVMSLAAATYGRVPMREAPPVPSFRPAPEIADHEFTMADARVEHAKIVWRFIAPSYATQKDGEAYAYEVLSEVLDSGEVGLLHKKLVSERGIASVVGTNYDPDARGETTFSILLSPHPGKPAASAQKALKQSLRDAAEKGVEAELVEKAKHRLKRAALFAREGLAVPGHAFGMALATGRTAADVESWPERIDAVTAAQVNAALRELASSKRQVMGALLPAGKAGVSKKAAEARP